MSADRGTVVARTVAGPVTLDATRWRDVETDELGAIQFSMTFEGNVFASMGEKAALLFIRFVQQTLEADEPVAAPAKPEKDYI